MEIGISIVGAVLTIVVFICLALKIIFGIRSDLGSSRMQADWLTKNKQQTAPLGLVSVVVPGSTVGRGADSVGIHAFNEIYESMGVTKKTLAEWESKHGMDSAGRDEDGSMLAFGYPVFSKVAWMYVDPVTLTSAETKALIQECHRVMLNGVSESAKHELAAISLLAEKALSNSAVIRFGHP